MAARLVREGIADEARRKPVPRRGVSRDEQPDNRRRESVKSGSELDYDSE